MKNFLAGIAQAGREMVGLRSDTAGSATFVTLCRDLLKLRGEAAAIALSDEILRTYEALEPSARRGFFEVLLGELEPDPAAVSRAFAGWHGDPGPATLQALNRASKSPRRDVIRALNLAPGGTEALVAMRADLLELLDDEPALVTVDNDFAEVFRSWFNRGFLTLTKIDWQTPAFVLEKLIAYEAVHEIRGWDDLRRRLADDRRCFAFFHPALPDEPLIFVQVAMVDGLAADIESLLDSTPVNAAQADTAIFYSISNCQRGLHGVSFGNFLIKQVVDMLADEMPALKHYATLSPIPGFRRWLDTMLSESPDELTLDDDEREQLALMARADEADDAAILAPLEGVLMRLCAHYLLKARRDDEPQDPVARFHLRNGARLERINWMADPTAKGIRGSAAMMVNYLYDRKTLLRNHEAFVNSGRIAASSAVRKLLG